MLIYMKIIFFDFLLLLGLISLSCKSQTNPITLKFNVTDFTSKPIGGAHISVNGSFVGLTDRKGLFSVIKLFNSSDKISIKISYETPDNYYEPFSEKIQINAIKNNVLKKNIVLYFVPKSTRSISPDEKNTISSQEIRENTPVQIEEKKEIPELISELIEEETEVENDKTVIIKSDLKNSNMAADEVKYPYPPQKKINVYTYAHKIPVNSVRISFGCKDTSFLSSGCTTNQRGRCQINIDPSCGNITIFAQKNGYLTEKIDSETIHKSQIKFTLQRGSSTTIITMDKSNSKRMGIMGSAIISEGKQIGVTDNFGICILNSYTNKNLTLSVKNDNYEPRDSYINLSPTSLDPIVVNLSPIIISNSPQKAAPQKSNF